MPRPRNPFPKPHNHKGAAVIDVYDGSTRRTRTLGPWGRIWAVRLKCKKRWHANSAGHRFKPTAVTCGCRGRPGWLFLFRPLR
jgi:hypothetical protein